MVQELPRSLAGLRRDWADLSIYQRFEAFVAFLLRVVIGAVILVALYRLFIDVWDTLVLRSRNPLEHSVFQRVFGGIMTVLIALEFNHTLKYAITRGRGIIQGRIVLLIALLALARKVIILDAFATAPATLAGLAALVAALGVTYKLVSDADRHQPAGGSRATASTSP